MNLFPKGKGGEAHRFPVEIAAVVVLIAVVVIFLVVQINSHKPAAVVSATPGLGEGQLFGTAFAQMQTAKANGTPMDSSNPLILTAKAIGATPDGQTPVSNNDVQLTVTAMLAIATQQASTPHS